MEMFFSVFKNTKNKKIVLATVLLGVVFLAAYVYEILTSYKIEIKRARVETINLSKVLQEQINASFTTIDFVLQELQENVQGERHKNKFSNENFIKMFSDKRMRLPFVKSFKVIDRDGYYIADDESLKKNVNLKDRAYFQKIKASNSNELVISIPVISKTSHVWVIVLARRLVDSHGDFDGVVLGSIALSYFKEQFEKLNLGSNGLVGLYDHHLVLHVQIPWVESTIGKTSVPLMAEYQKFFDSAENLNVNQSVFPLDGIERLTTIRKLEMFPLAVIVGLSTRDFTREWRKRSMLYGLSMLMVFCVFLYFLFIFLKSQDDLEDQRHQAIHASKLSSLGEMASGIAHEINNPLTIISALATRTKKNLNDKSLVLEKSLENQDKIIATVERIAKIIGGLRAFSRDTNGDPFSKNKVSDLISMTLDLCRERLKDNGVDVQLEAFINVEIECREVQIVQVLVNLLHNASDAISELPEKWVRISTWEYGELVYIRVTDSGNGIDDKIIEKMMMPFFTTKEVGKGTGLGLSISKGIIEAHQGQFYYRKFDGHTSFVIELKKSLDV